MVPLAALATPDWIVLAVAAFMALRGVFKGFAWQAVRTVGLGVSLWLATAWHEGVGQWIDERIGFVPSTAAPWIAWVILVTLTFFLATWIAWVCRGAIRRVRLGTADRWLGLVAGAALGFLLVTAGYLAWGSLAPDGAIEDALRGSVSGPWMARAVGWFEPLVPGDQRRRWYGVLRTLDVGG